MADRDLQKDVETLRTDLETVRKDLATLTDTLKETAKARMQLGVETAEAEVKPALAQLRQTLDKARGRGREGLQTVAGQVEERPLVTLAAAFGLGLLIGRLLDRR